MRRVLLTLLGTAAIIITTQVAHAETYIVVTSSDGTDPFWPVVNRGAEDAGKAVGASVVIRHPDRVDPVEMADIIDTAIAQHPDGLVISVMDADVIGPEIKKAVDAGIPVVAINSHGEEARKYGAMFYVGQPEYKAGQAAGAKAKALGVTKQFCILGSATLTALRDRCRGYANALGVQPNIVESGSDPEEIKARASAYLASHPNINGILATDPFGCPAVKDAIAESGREGKVILGCFDLTPEIITMIKAGQVAFTVDQQEYLQGYMPIIALNLYSKYGIVPADDILSGPGFVTKNNVAQVAAVAGKYR
jgi:simple sugar transport system substrate-binding protein